MNDDELMAILAELGVAEDKSAIFKDQLAQAQALRNYQPQNTIQTRAGRVPAYGSIIAGMFQRGKGERQYNQAIDSLYGTMDKQTAARRQYAKALQTPDQKLAGMGVNQTAMTSQPELDEDELLRQLGY